MNKDYSIEHQKFYPEPSESLDNSKQESITEAVNLINDFWAESNPVVIYNTEDIPSLDIHSLEYKTFKWADKYYDTIYQLNEKLKKHIDKALLKWLDKQEPNLKRRVARIKKKIDKDKNEKIEIIEDILEAVERSTQALLDLRAKLSHI